ncbi:hypothetical protein FQN60_016719, partial [Etheostoma spectabile]
MQNRQAYDKVFQKIWGASGGLAAIMCPCGVLYSLKFNIRAEGPRDFADMLLSDLAQRILPGEWTVIHSKDIKIMADQEEAKRPRRIPPEHLVRVNEEPVDLTKEMGILEITRSCLEYILLEVVLHDGDKALMTLAL